MFSLFSRVKPFEWGLLGALVLLCLVVWFGGHAYLDLRDRQVKTEQSLGQSQTDVKNRDQLSQVADRVVRDSIVNQAQQERVLVETRKGAIDEYLTVRPPEPTSEPIADPAVKIDPVPQTMQPLSKPVEVSPAVTDQPRESIKAKTPPRSPPRLSLKPKPNIDQLAVRMHEKYCAAVSAGDGCQSSISTSG